MFPMHIKLATSHGWTLPRSHGWILAMTSIKQSATERLFMPVSKAFSLILAMLISTITREECSKTSSATNWPLLHLRKPFDLILTSLAPTLTRDVYSNILEEEEKLSKPTIEQSNWAM